MSTRDDRRYAESSLRILREPYVGHGKLEVLPKVVARDLEDIALLYTPGVGYAVKEILAHGEALGELTGRDNTIAVVTDGSAVLGLGRAGPRAALPVMEGKASMFKLLVGIDAVPLCLDVRDPEQLLDILEATEPSFGGYNLEDIAAPDCFDIMEQAPARLTVPIIHDDQYGTATVIIAALLNAFKLLGRDATQQRVVICGDGAAGTATARLLKGALDCGALRVDHDACLAAARAIAGDVPESELRPDNILPTPGRRCAHREVACFGG